MAADLITEAVGNIERLSGGSVFDLGAEYNLLNTLRLVQSETANYSQLIAEGKSWGGNPKSTMTTAYPKEAVTPTPLPLPLPSFQGVIPLPPMKGVESKESAVSSGGGLAKSLTGQNVSILAEQMRQLDLGPPRAAPTIVPLPRVPKAPGSPSPQQIREQIQMAQAYEAEVNAEQEDWEGVPDWVD